MPPPNADFSFRTEIRSSPRAPSAFSATQADPAVQQRSFSHLGGLGSPPRRNIDDQLGELVGVPTRLGGVTLLKFFKPPLDIGADGLQNR
jgi:hypothetical protein